MKKGIKKQEKVTIRTLSAKNQKLEDKVDNLKKEVTRLKSTVLAHINRQFAEWKVLDKPKADGEDNWTDYTGLFYSSSEDNKNVILEKAQKHFDKYFKKSIFHKNKTLGLFLSSARSGRQLIETRKTK